MEEDAWRCAGRLPGAKDFDGEADGVIARALARLPHHEPAALTADVAAQSPSTQQSVRSKRGRSD